MRCFRLVSACSSAGACCVVEEEEEECAARGGVDHGSRHHDEDSRGAIDVIDVVDDEVEDEGILIRIEELDLCALVRSKARIERGSSGIEGTSTTTTGDDSADGRATRKADTELYATYSGGCLWDTSIVMTRWIATNSHLFKEKRVLELGSGCGLVGLAVAWFASAVTLTDYLPEILENLNHNVRMMQPNKRRLVPSRVKVTHFDWNDRRPSGEDEDLQHIRYDIVLGSEVTYRKPHAELISDVVDACLLPGGSFYEMAASDREGLQELRTKLSNRGYTCRMEEVDASLTQDPSFFDCSNLVLLTATKPPL